MPGREHNSKATVPRLAWVPGSPEPSSPKHLGGFALAGIQLGLGVTHMLELQRAGPTTVSLGVTFHCSVVTFGFPGSAESFVKGSSLPFLCDRIFSSRVFWNCRMVD